MSIWRWFLGKLIAMDAALLIVAAHHLPLPIGRAWATVRGVVHAGLGYDWLSSGTGRYRVRPMVWRSLRRLAPKQPPWRRLLALVGRYVEFSIAQWEGLALPRLIDRLPAFVPPDASAGEDATDQRGTVHFMFHYGAVYPTITWLAKGGATVNFLTSDVYRRIPGISPWIEKIYIEINSNLSRHVNGGDVILTNQNIRNLYRKLLAGEDVVILVDRTVANGPSVTVDLPGPCRCPWLAAPGR